jgi:hypothetical protein
MTGAQRHARDFNIHGRNANAAKFTSDVENTTSLRHTRLYDTTTMMALAHTRSLVPSGS